jgi:hypothetical protein
MPTHTVPDTTAVNVSENQISLSVVDASGDGFTELVKTPGGAILGAADIQAFNAAYKAATQASVWRVEQSIVWEGSRNPTNADVAYRANAEKGINITLQDTDVFNATAHQRIVAPIAALMVGNTDSVLTPFPAAMSALLAAYITLLGAGYSTETLQYTTRRERRNNTRLSV